MKFPSATAKAMYVGTLSAVMRWPVKSLRGEEMDAAWLGIQGVAGDRAYMLVDDRPGRVGNPVTVRQAPGVLAFTGSYPDAPGVTLNPDSAPSEPTIRGPHGMTWAWSDPALPVALADNLGIPVVLEHAPLGRHDRPGTVLVTVEASRAALESDLGRSVDLRRFRPNLHLELRAPAYAEEAWGPGTTLTIGETQLEVTGPRSGPCIRCVVPSWDPHGRQRWPELQSWLIEQRGNTFGVILRVTRPGTARVGDPVAIRPGAWPCR